MITQDIDFAVQCLQQGDLVAFPTETVYGLGADARNPLAVQKVFQAKGRPADHPLIVHIGSIEQLDEWAQDIPAIAWDLATHFWPGPLTLILRKQPNVSTVVTGGQDTIGIRIPNHPLTLKLLQQFGAAIVGPSANKYGHVSPTTAQHVADDLGTAVHCILDGGPCTVGIESTIIALTQEQPIIMRAGMIRAAEISMLIGNQVTTYQQTPTLIRTAGMHAAHYAPATPVQISADLLTSLQQLHNQGKKIAVLSFQPSPNSLHDNIYWQQASTDPTIYAHDLYANLRDLDHLHMEVILIEQVPNQPAWLAINDRLNRASYAAD